MAVILGGPHPTLLKTLQVECENWRKMLYKEPFVGISKHSLIFSCTVTILSACNQTDVQSTNTPIL